MKKFSIMLLGVMALGFVACDDAPVDAPVQVNAQPGMYNKDQVSGTVDGVLASSQVLNLGDYQYSTQGIPVAKFTTTPEFPAGATLSGVLQLAKDDSFSVVEDVNVTVENGIGYANAEEWNNAHVALFGKAMTEREVYWRLAGYVDIDGGIYHLGAPDYYVATGSVEEICFDLGINIADAYYFMSDATSWALDAESLAPFKMYHSVANPLDDPIFTFIIYNQNGNCYWKISTPDAIENQNWDILYGPATNGDTSLSSMCIEGGNAGRIEDPGVYKIEFDAISLEYTITKYKSNESPYLYTPGDANGWSMYSSQWLTYNSDSDSYLGVVNSNGTFKLAQMLYGATWDGNLNWGGSNDTLEANGANISATGFYWMTASPSIGTYELLPIEKVSLIGGGDWNTDRYLTPNDDMTIWTAELDIDGEWKLRFNDNWDYNYGAPMNAPQPNGGNFNTASGHYLLTVNFTGNLPYITVEPK